uniref:Uncharacterized protein n=1 Tax=Anguilla anguilla TaxID=7936 RepID=A0A0E9WBK1_ANGAN
MHSEINELWNKRNSHTIHTTPPPQINCVYYCIILSLLSCLWSLLG